MKRKQDELKMINATDTYTKKIDTETNAPTPVTNITTNMPVTLSIESPTKQPIIQLTPNKAVEVTTKEDKENITASNTNTSTLTSTSNLESRITDFTNRISKVGKESISMSKRVDRDKDDMIRRNTSMSKKDLRSKVLESSIAKRNCELLTKSALERMDLDECGGQLQFSKETKGVVLSHRNIDLS